MLTLQELADIAARYATATARAMVRACIVSAYATGEPLRIDRAASRAQRPDGGPRDIDGPDFEEWRRMCEGNRETRAAWRGR